MPDPNFTPPAEDRAIPLHDREIRKWEQLGSVAGFLLGLSQFLIPIPVILYFVNPAFARIIDQSLFLFIALGVFLAGFWIFGSYRLAQLKLKKRRAKDRLANDWQIPE